MKFYCRQHSIRSVNHPNRRFHQPSRSPRLMVEALEDRFAPAGILVTGAGAGGGPQVRVFDAESLAPKFSFFAYDAAFTGGVRVAVADVNGDGNLDIIAAPGPGGGPNVRVFDGTNGTLLSNFMAFDPGFTGGVNVAAGDVDADNRADIICGPDSGGGPTVSVFRALDGKLLRTFLAYDPNFTGGVRVAAGDFDRTGLADVVTAPGPGGGPNVQVLDLHSG